MKANEFDVCLIRINIAIKYKYDHSFNKQPLISSF